MTASVDIDATLVAVVLLGRVVLPERMIEDGAVVIEGDRIA